MGIRKHVPFLFAFLALALAAQQGEQVPEGDLDQSPLARLDVSLRESVQQSLQSRDYHRAEQLLVDELNRHPDAALYAFLGGLFFLDKQYLNAGIALKKADVLQPLSEANRFTLAMCYVVLKMPEKARSELRQLTRSSPRDARPRYWLARLDYDDQRMPEAVQGFQEAIKLAPDNFRAYDNLGLVYEAMGRNDEALASYARGAELNTQRTPCSPWPAHNMGALLRKLGRDAEAKVRLKESLLCGPDFGRAHYQLGLVLETQGMPREAISSLRRASALEPEFPDPHYALGRILRREGHKEEADKELKLFSELKAKQRK